MSSRPHALSRLRRWGTEPAVRVIEPRPPGMLSQLSEFWRYRRLVPYFGFQMLQKLYRRTYLGWLWIPLRPVIAVVTSAFVFGGLLGVSSGKVPYALFFLVTISAFEFFATTMLWATRSLELGKRVLRRMYVPRLVCLVGSLVTSGTLFLVYSALTLVGILVFWIVDGTPYVVVGLNSLGIVGSLGLMALMGLALCGFTSPFAARARDVRFAVNYGMGFWMFLTPVIYPLSEVPDGYRTVIELNPLTAPIELFRIGVFDQGTVPLTAALSCAIFIAVLLPLGLGFFLKAEERSLDGV